MIINCREKIIRTLLRFQNYVYENGKFYKVFKYVILIQLEGSED